MEQDIETARKTCLELIAYAESLAEDGSANEMQHGVFAKVQTYFHEFPKLKKEFSQRCKKISQKGYSNAIRISLPIARKYMELGRWNEGDRTLRAILDAYAPRAGYKNGDMESLERQAEKIWQSYHLRNRTNGK